MADQTFWTQLRDEFRSLPDPDKQLRALWSSLGWSGDATNPQHWYVAGSTDQRLHDLFGYLVERGVLAMGQSLENSSALDFWFDQLRFEGRNYKGGLNGVRENEDRTHVEFEAGEISRICEASADFCLKLANQAIRGTEIQKEMSPSVTDGDRKFVTTAKQERGKVRSSVVDPILIKKGMSASGWATKAGVDPSVVYDYLNGISNPRRESRNVLAEAIGITEAELPR